MTVSRISHRLEIVGRTGKPHICRQYGSWRVFKCEHYVRYHNYRHLYASEWQQELDRIAQAYARAKNQQESTNHA